MDLGRKTKRVQRKFNKLQSGHDKQFSQIKNALVTNGPSTTKGRQLLENDGLLTCGSSTTKQRRFPVNDVSVVCG